MQWSIDVFEREISKPGTNLERFIIHLENSVADRSISLRFIPSKSPNKSSIFNISILRISTGKGFSLKSYIKQYFGVNVNPDGFQYSSYPGNFEEKVRGFLKFIADLLEKYAKPTLQGTEWPEVEFDWKGYK